MIMSSGDPSASSQPSLQLPANLPEQLQAVREDSPGIAGALEKAAEEQAVLVEGDLSFIEEKIEHHQGIEVGEIIPFRSQ